EHLLEFQLITPDQAREIMTTNVGGLLGLQDDPYRQRIRRQIARWDEGPPEGWRQPPEAAPGVPAPVPAPLPDVVTVDPMTGQPVINDPVLAAIWEPVACDTLPDVAAVRLNELKAVMSSTRYFRHPPEWRAGLDAEYQRMLMALMPPAPPLMPPAPPPQPAPGGGGGGGAQPAPAPAGPSPAGGPQDVLPVDAVQEGVPPELVGA